MERCQSEGFGALLMATSVVPRRWTGTSPATSPHSMLSGPSWTWTGDPPVPKPSPHGLSYYCYSIATHMKYMCRSVGLRLFHQTLSNLNQQNSWKCMDRERKCVTLFYSSKTAKEVLLSNTQHPVELRSGRLWVQAAVPVCELCIHDEKTT